MMGDDGRQDAAAAGQAEAKDDGREKETEGREWERKAERL